MSAELPEPLAKELDAKCQGIAIVLASVDIADQAALLARVVQRIVEQFEQIKSQTNGTTHTDPAQANPPQPIQPTPELLEWAMKQFTEEEAIAGLHEIRQTGGLTFAEVIRDLEPPAEHG